mmetsp:Transcript_28734/g.82195  ORF Transcript_28734/g.82195 Transcript_28734/m.82195 type:complete len:487 (-) Transcript_28734:57-1517(-)
MVIWLLLGIPFILTVHVGATYWTIQSGPCTTANNCLQSPNFPADYGDGERCVVSVPASSWTDHYLEADATFYTEGCCDTLTINGIAYSGSNAPDNIVPSGTITWSSDPQPSGGTQLSWRLCPRSSSSASSGTEETSEGSSSNGWVIPVVAVVAVLVLGAMAAGMYFFLCSGKKADTSKASASPAPAPHVVRPMAMPPMVIPPAPITDPAGDADESGLASSSWIKNIRDQVDVPDEESRVPKYWKLTRHLAGSVDLQDVTRDEQAAVQSLLDSTFRKITTRDRRTEIPERLKLVQVQRIENCNLWKKYASGRYAIRNKRPHKCTSASTFGGEVLTMQSLPKENQKSTTPRINEVYLWHGTSPAGAMGISKDGFSLRYSGTKTGSMYGNGVYFAECSSKSDEYATDDVDGIYRGLYCLLLCRVCLGELLHLQVGGEATHSLIKTAMEDQAYDSVLGDRKASVGTYREFVIYQEDQVYPEYLVLYKREV